MKLLHALFLAALLAAPSASCKSNEPAQPCVCGTQLGDLEGCTHPMCRDGETNPDNPQCVCGELEIPGARKE